MQLAAICASASRGESPVSLVVRVVESLTEQRGWLARLVFVSPPCSCWPVSLRPIVPCRGELGLQAHPHHTHSDIVLARSSLFTIFRPSMCENGVVV